jgi:hypothetical protein
MNNQNQQNNMSNTDQQILEIYNSLPKIIQDAITKSGWENSLRNIVNKYQLRIDQGTQLENMTFALMMGQLSAEDYYDSILNEFGLEQDKAKNLFEEIDASIFGNIEDIIRKLEVDQENEKLTANSSQPTAVSKQAQQPQSLKEPDTDLQKEIDSEGTFQVGKDRQRFVKDNVDDVARNDEILTVTRDEVLRDIEEPEKIGQAMSQDNPTASSLPDLKSSSVMPKNQSSSSDEHGSGQAQAVETETKLTESGPVDPIAAGLDSRVSTSSRDYRGSDPYREPLE